MVLKTNEASLVWMCNTKRQWYVFGGYKTQFKRKVT